MLQQVQSLAVVRYGCSVLKAVAAASADHRLSLLGCFGVGVLFQISRVHPTLLEVQAAIGETLAVLVSPATQVQTDVRLCIRSRQLRAP